jgi:hypothetical protein
MTKHQVTRLLGRPDERGARAFAWDVGPERDSVVRIDAEYSEVRFDRHDWFRAASFYQG